MGNCMGTFQRGDDPFVPTQHIERLHGLLVGGGEILYANRVLEVAVLGADAGVVQPAGDRMRGRGFVFLILQMIAAKTMKRVSRPSPMQWLSLCAPV